MNAQIESVKSTEKEQLYVLEKLTDARKAISKGCGELVTNRAKVEKYRVDDLPRAQKYYLELRKTQKRILDALRDAQLALLEMENTTLALTAGKLYKGLSGFNKMYPKEWTGAVFKNP